MSLRRPAVRGDAYFWGDGLSHFIQIAKLTGTRTLRMGACSRSSRPGAGSRRGGSLHFAKPVGLNCILHHALKPIYGVQATP